MSRRRSRFGTGPFGRALAVATCRRRRDERGAVLVMTCLSLFLLMAFTALAIDIGQRNQQLARAQHAIDASVLGAAQWLSAHPGDYAGANIRVKRLMEMNLGLASGVWNTCTDGDHLDELVVGDTTCISYRKVTAAATGAVKYDIRVRLPQLRMDTVFGSALGVDTIDLSAVASSNGNNCGGSTSGPNCGPGTTTVTTTIPETTTTTTLEQYCKQLSMLDFAVNDPLWQQCQKTRTGENIDTWRTYVCTQDTLTDGPVTWNVTDMHHYIWWWTGLCEKYGNVGARDKWLGTICYGDTATIYSDWGLWSACTQKRSSLQDWDAYWKDYWSTTTTSPPTTAGPKTTTTAAGPTTTVPTSIDLSS